MSTEHNIIQQYTCNNHSKSEKVNLSLSLDNESFIYVLFNHDFSNIIELCELKYGEAAQNTSSLFERVGGFIHNFQLLDKNLNQINISVLNNDFSILPESFAIKNKTKDILEFSSGTISANIYTQKFKELSFNYGVDGQLLSLLERYFKTAKIRHAGSIAINLFFTNRSLKNADVLLNFNSNNFELLAKSESKLLYYNVFSYENKEDVLYYLLFMMEQFNLDPINAKLFVAGQIEEPSETYQALKKYISNISFVVNEVNMEGKDKNLKLPNHFYFTLLNQHLCE